MNSKQILFILALIPALIGCGEVWEYLDPQEQTYTCTSYYQPKANVTNWTGADIDLEMVYSEGYGGKALKTARIQLPSNKSYEAPLPQYAKSEKYVQAAKPNCSEPGPYPDRTLLRLNANSFALVKACEFNDQWVIIVALSSICPPYTKQQGKPL